MSESNEISAVALEAALEAALPSFTGKLEELKKGLSPDEQCVLSSIVSSAVLHLEAMQPLSHSENIRDETAIVVSVRVNGNITVIHGNLSQRHRLSWASRVHDRRTPDRAPN